MINILKRHDEMTVADKTHDYVMALLAGFAFFSTWLWFVNTEGFIGMFLGWIPAFFIMVTVSYLWSFLWGLAEKILINLYRPFS